MVGTTVFTVFYGDFLILYDAIFIHVTVERMYETHSAIWIIFIYVSVLILNSIFGCLLFVVPLVLIGGFGINMPKLFPQYPLETYTNSIFIVSIGTSCIYLYIGTTWVYSYYKDYIYIHVNIFKALCICIGGLWDCSARSPLQMANGSSNSKLLSLPK